MEELREQIIQYLKKLFENTDQFVVDVKTGSNYKIAIFIDDKTQHIAIDKCVMVSRKIEEFLEEQNLVPEKYTLEVSSPGMDMPFKVMEQYQKAIGIQLSVLLKNGVRVEGALEKIGNDTITVHSVKRKKGKIIEEMKQELAFANIKTTTKVITF